MFTDLFIHVSCYTLSCNCYTLDSCTRK